ncbi:MAG: hypothetical protein ACOZE5_03980 [Verrucomicrobiota bacterium]
MALLIAERIRKREFGKEISSADKDSLLDGARVALTETIAGRGLPAGTKLLKAYATTKQGPRRILYLLLVREGDLFVLFYRTKDDVVGANMSPTNPSFNAALAKHLDLLRKDLASGKIEEIVRASDIPAGEAPG